MNWKNLLEEYKSSPIFNQHRYDLACQGDLLEIVNVGTDFASIKRFGEAVSCWEYVVSLGKANAEAYNNLGVSYFYGNGVKQDRQKAVHYYQKAVALGHPFGQYNLAVAYENGQGTPKDIKKAVELYRKAAEQHINMAIDALIHLENYDELRQFQIYQRNLSDKSFSGLNE